MPTIIITVGYRTATRPESKLYLHSHFLPLNLDHLVDNLKLIRQKNTCCMFMSPTMVLVVFPIVIERSISFSNLLRNRGSASFFATSVLPSLPPRRSLRSLPPKLGRTLITARNSSAQKHGCEPCHRVRRKRCPGLQVCAAFQVERMGERKETRMLLRRMLVANLFMSPWN